ncbi:MAG: site-2 protease family protein [Caulobacter sp.]|nr:site-2 protease family protein [Caulobacter sp.]
MRYIGDGPRRSGGGRSGAGGWMSRNFVIAVAIFMGACAALASGSQWPRLAIGVLTFVAVGAGWVVALCLHEFGHAYVAWRGGDYTVPGQGYLTLDPVKYAHPVLSIIIPLAFFAMGGFGFPGAAVSVRLDLLKSRRWRSFTALAGPAGTLIFLLALAAPFWLGLDRRFPEAIWLWCALAVLAFMQATALILNLMPLPGLDGYAAIRPHVRGGFGQWLGRIDAAPAAGFLPIVLLLMVPGVSSLLIRAGALLTGLLGFDLMHVMVGLSAFQFWKGGGLGG